MSSRVRLVAFVSSVAIASAVALVAVAPFHIADPWTGMFLLASLAMLGGASPVRVPALKTAVSTSDPFVFTALAALGPLPACVVSICGVFGAAARKQPGGGTIKFLFNVANVSLSTASGAAVFLALGGVPGAPIGELLGPLFIAATAYLVLNTALVTGAVALDTGRPFMSTWRESALWTAVSTFVGFTLAAGLVFVLHRLGTVGLALGVPPCWLITAFYRTHKERQEIQQEKIDQIESLNQRLEEKVAERTGELQDTLARLEGANASLRRTNEQLTEANRAKSEFLANVSHELRTPLNAIIGFSELLGSPAYGALPPEQRDFVQDIHDSGTHLLGLINGILDLSKIEARKMEVRRAEICVHEAIEEAVSMVRPQAGRKRLQLEIDCARDGAQAFVDPSMFRRVLINLLSNATKFTPHEGRVSVTARRMESDLVVEVQDTGIGISQENVERIFDEFYQVDGSHSRNYEGTGLGLALVRCMVEMHGGRVEVSSEVGKGSVFRVRFGAAFPEASLEEDEVPVPEPCRAEPVRCVGQSTGRVVLLVDANPLDRRLARNSLKARGYDVLETESGESALDIARSRPVDLVLLDLELPGMSGIETTRRLKSDPRSENVPVVALAAEHGPIEAGAESSEDYAGFIKKPIRIARFPAQIAEHLSRPT